MKRASLALVILLLLPALCRTQPSRDSWDNLKQLQPGQKVQVEDMQMKSFKGEFISFSDVAILLRVEKSEQSLARADVMRVSVRDTSHRNRNMLIGAAIGVGAGLAIAIPVLAICSNEGNCGSNTAGAAVAVAALGAGGTGIGAIPGIRTVYRAKARKGSVTP